MNSTLMCRFLHVGGRGVGTATSIDTLHLLESSGGREVRIRSPCTTGQVVRVNVFHFTGPSGSPATLPAFWADDQFSQTWNGGSAPAPHPLSLSVGCDCDLSI